MLLYRHGIICAALNGSIIRDNHAFLPLDHPDAGYNSRRWCLIVIHVPCCKRAKFQERGVRIAELLNSFASQQFVAFMMSGDCFHPTTLLYLLHKIVQLVEQFFEIPFILLVLGTFAIYMCFDNTH